MKFGKILLIFVLCFGYRHCTTDINNPTPVYVKVGEDAILQCGYGDAKMTWYINGTVIANKNAIIDINKYSVSMNQEGLYYRLHIQNVRESDLQTYKCLGSTSVSFFLKLYLKVAPTGLSLDDVTDNKIRGTEGQSLTITCTATGGQPPPDITLTVSGIITSGVQSVSYIIPVLKRSHDKQPVRCQAHNTAMENPMIRDAILYLFLKPSLPILSEKNPRANETQLLTISCSSHGSRPAAVFYWKLNQAIVPTGFTQQNISDPATETYNVTSTLTYKVNRSYNGKNITCGVYHSALTNPLKRDESLIVYYAPDVTVVDKTYTNHDDVRTVTCVPVGNPSVYTYYKWQHKSKYGELIRYLDGGDNGVLTLPNVTDSQRYQDSGEYKCNVSNGIGNENGNIQQSASGIVQVQAQPVFANEKTNLIEYGEIEKDFIKHYYVYSVPKYTSTSLYKNDGATNLMDRSKYQITDLPATVNMTFHGVFVQQDGYRMTLTIKALKESDFNTNYTFECLNQFGKSRSNFTLKSASAPQTPLNFSVISATYSSVIVQWIPGYSGGADQTFHVQYREVNSTEDWDTVDVLQNYQKSAIQMYTVPGLKANTMYQLRMYSNNQYNRSTYTDIESIQTVGIEKGPGSTAAVIGGVIGGLSGIIVLLIICTAVLLIRRQRGKSACSEKDESDGLKDNILYESQPHSLTQSKTEDNSVKRQKSNADYVEGQQPSTMYAEVNRTPDKNEKVKKNKAGNAQPKKAKKHHKKAPTSNAESEYSNAGFPLNNLEQKENSNSEEKNGASNRFTNADGLQYADLSFTDDIRKKGKFVIHGADDRTMYATVDHSTTAPLPPPESEYEDTNIGQGKPK